MLVRGGINMSKRHFPLYMAVLLACPLLVPILICWQQGSDLFYQESSNNMLLVHDSTCKISATKAFPDFLESLWQMERAPDCSYEQLFTALEENDTVLTVDPNYLSQYMCSLQSVNLDGWTTVVSNLSARNDVSQLEMFYAKCGTLHNFYQRMRVKSETARKIYVPRKRVGVDVDQINVLFLGLDTVSRSHFLRSLPKTVETLFSKLGFVDFRGFHALAPDTGVNTAAFLMGLQSCNEHCTSRFLNQSCSLGLNGYLDDCPIIFKEFSRWDYITSYMDNSEHEFSLFPLESPVADFHVHPIFHVVRQAREHVLKPVDRGCLTTESEVEFMISYMEKFLRTLQDSPFFLFAWFATPFHYFPFSLSQYDSDLNSFFTNIPPRVLEKTLIIITGDHGAEYEYRSGGRDEVYIERSLPPLFVRLPEYLARRFPQMKRNIEENSIRLTTSFDVHHTLLHLLNLQCFPTNSDGDDNVLRPESGPPCKFESILKDRASLLERVPRDRTCQSLHVPQNFCVCNVTGEIPDKLTERASDLQQFASYSIKKINAAIKRSSARFLCHEWLISNQPESITTSKVTTRDGWTRIFLRFYAKTRGGHNHHGRFEVQLKLNKSKRSGGRLRSGRDFQLIPGTAVRIDAKWNEIACVKNRTEYKDIKRLCYCLDSFDRRP